MKKIIFILLILQLGNPSFVFARKSRESYIESQIIAEVIDRLTEGKNLKIFSSGLRPRVLALLEEKFDFEESCQGAGIAILSADQADDPECKDVPRFVQGMVPYDMGETHFLGAFYWKKGRPNISLFCNRVEEEGFSVGSLSKYCE